MFGISRKTVVLLQCRLKQTNKQIKFKVMTPTELQDQFILAVSASTCVNGKKNKSRFTGQQFFTGDIQFERTDGCFFQNTQFEGCEWNVFFNYSDNSFQLTNLESKNTCSIYIDQYEPK